MSQTAADLLISKYKRIMQRELMDRYRQDIEDTTARLQVANQTCLLLTKAANYTRALPFLARALTLPNEDALVDSKILYDQAKLKNKVDLDADMLHEGNIKKPFYIYTK